LLTKTIKPPPRRGKRQNWAVNFALMPMAVTVLLCYLGTVLWSIVVSMTSSKTFPNTNFVGLAQYEKLFTTDRWWLSLHNMALFGVIFVIACLVLGFFLAVFIDQKVRGEGIFRTIFLYPYAMSFVATGLVWQWMLNPGLGLQEAVRQLGFPNFEFDWIISQDKVMYAIALAAVWQSAGLVMALLLAGLRGVDEEIWKAARIDGIPVWRVYLSIVVPMIAPSIATATVLLSLGVIKVFDVVVSMTGGGPGIASEVPAKFIMDYLFNRANIGLASAASVVLLLTVLALLLPWLYAKNRMEKNNNKGH
jgi:glucose/mannose transport system permease protein